jgi:hypothetical protein
MKSPTIECLESPPERHADRVTADMIRFLIAQRAGTNARVEAELVRSFGKRDGNPKAQAKFVERVRSVGGKTLLSVLLCPGKRGGYSLVILRLGWVRSRAKPHDPRVRRPAPKALASLLDDSLFCPRRKTRQRHGCFPARYAPRVVAASAAAWRARARRSPCGSAGAGSSRDCADAPG